mmetsp:Transcript_1365/g.2977  ORF Transcript_1365/g.2977 Transcript_1365/m.2977 type:complete len:139 (-) Transcript_1365:366-782(-)
MGPPDELSPPDPEPPLYALSKPLRRSASSTSPTRPAYAPAACARPPAAAAAACPSALEAAAGPGHVCLLLLLGQGHPLDLLHAPDGAPRVLQRLGAWPASRQPEGRPKSSCPPQQSPLLLISGTITFHVLVAGPREGG